MGDELEKDKFTRRGFLGVSSAALAATGFLSPSNLPGQEKADRTPNHSGPNGCCSDAGKS